MSDSETKPAGEKPARILFPQGLVGLEKYRQFILGPLPEQEAFMFLKSLDDDDFGLVLTNPFWFMPDYEFELADRHVKELGTAQDLQIFVTVTLAARPQDITVNLAGPIIVNRQTGKGVQIVIENKEYTTKHHLMAAGKTGG
jgi:flagellar assembly factor FliW